jgi:hypothetical protein
MRHTVAHQVLPDLLDKWAPMVNPVAMAHLAKTESQANSLLPQPGHSHHAGPALLDLRVPLDHPDPPDPKELLDVPDPRAETETPASPAPTELADLPDHLANLANPAHEDPLAKTDPVVSRETQVPKVPPATVDHPVPLAKVDQMATPDSRVHPAPPATTELPETLVPLASPVPPDSPDHLARMPNTVLALLAVLAARAKSPDRSLTSHSLFSLQNW